MTASRIRAALIALTLGMQIALLVAARTPTTAAAPTFAPCPREPLVAWQACVEQSVLAAQNRTVELSGAIMNVVRSHDDQLRAHSDQLRGHRLAIGTLHGRLEVVEARPVGLTRDDVWNLFFGDGPDQQWQWNIIANAELRWQDRTRLWAASFIKQRVCQLAKAEHIVGGRNLPATCS